jgi:hypothetical protein
MVEVVSRSADLSAFPSEYPSTSMPSDVPSKVVSEVPTELPSEFPSQFPSDFPSLDPSKPHSKSTIVEWAVKIDCQHNSLRVSMATNIGVTFYKDDGTAVDKTVNEACSINSFELFVMSAPSTINITHFIVKIDGDDHFLMDRLFLYSRYKLQGEQVQQWGVNNGIAWCLSTDPNDKEFFVRHGLGIELLECYSCIRFAVVDAIPVSSQLC